MTQEFALIFDLDGTLIDSLPDIATAANATLAEFNLPALDLETIGGFVGRGFQPFVARLVDTYPDLADKTDQLNDRFMAQYIKASRHSTLFDGVAQALAKRTEPMGLCTNKAMAPTRAVLNGLGWENMFGSVIAGDSLATRKPNPEMLIHCLHELDAKTCLYVGDSEVDAQTAQNAKLPFALFTQGIRTTPVDQIPHDYAFDDWADFGGIVDQARAKA